MQKKQESKKLKIALKKEIDCNFIYSDDEENGEDEEDEGPMTSNQL